MSTQLPRRLQGSARGKSERPTRPSAQRRHILLEALEPRTLLSSIPTGAVETLNLNTISGWVFNADDGANPLNVTITVDGQPTTLTANIARPDLATKLGSPNHGFSFTMPALNTGNNPITVTLSDPYTSYTATLKTTNLVVAPPSGTVETLNATTISGWALSAANNAAPVQVVITLDGHATTLTANLSRPDLASKLGSANHGFSFSVPTLATGAHTVTVDVLDPTTNTPKRIRTGSIIIAPPTGSVDTFNAAMLAGWTYSAANGGAPLQVIITINGNQVSLMSNDLRPDLLKKVGSSDHSFSYAMPALKPGANTITVNAVDASTGQLKLLKSATINVGGALGSVTTFNTTTISGWAFSPLEGPAPLNIVITLNGQATTLSADQSLTTLAQNYGSMYHAFSYSVPALNPGNNTITIDAVDPFTGQTTRLKSGTLINRPPTGGSDIHTATQIAGWASDPDSLGPIQVQIKVNGVALSAPFTANDPRKMNGKTAVGFNATGNFAGQVVEVFAFDQPSNQPILIWTNNHPPRGAATSITGFNVTGWAVDPDAPNTPINVRVDIDGVTLNTVLANIARPDLAKLAGAVNVGFAIPILGLTPGAHTIAVYALDGQASAAAPILLAKKTIINNPPIGKVETVNASLVSGWALDPDLGASPATVNVYVDDALFSTTTANLPRPDLASKYGSPNHGFSVDLSSLPAGSHSITVTVMDDRTSNQDEVVIYDGFINNQQPLGLIEQVSSTTISGWAFDPDAGPNPIDVDIYVDGVFTRTITANLPDDNASEPTPNHGFSTALPSLSFGTHRIDVYAAESQGNVSVLIGSRTITNNRPIGALESIVGSTISGWAADPDILGQSIQVQIFVDGQQEAAFTSGGGRPDLLSLAPFNAPGAPAFSNYGFSITLATSFTPGTHQIDLFAVDPNNGQLSSLGSQLITV